MTWWQQETLANMVNDVEAWDANFPNHSMAVGEEPQMANQHGWNMDWRDGV